MIFMEWGPPKNQILIFSIWGPPRLDVSRAGGYWDADSEPNEIDSEMSSASACILISGNPCRSCTKELWRRKPLGSPRYQGMGDSNEEMAQL